MINSSPDGYLELPLDQTLPDKDKTAASWWERKSIRFKTTALAIAISTIPTLAVGSTAYYFAARSIEQETTSLRKTLVADLQNQVNLFMSDRLGDIKVMANLSILTDPRLRQITTAAEKAAALQKIEDAHGVYNSIAVFDARGDFIAKTDGKSLGNHLNRGYIQAAIKADGAIISQPRISTTTGIYSIYTASPIKDRVSGETIGFVRARMPVAVLKDLLKEYTFEGNQYYLFNDQGDIFLGSAGEYVIKTRSDNSAVDNESFDYEAIQFKEIFSDVNSLLSSNSLNAARVINRATKKEQFLTYAPAKTFKGLPSLNWQAVVAADSSVVFAPQRQLRRVFILGIGIVALGVGAIAYILANRLLRPILSAADAVKEIGRGNLNTRLKIKGADEISQLSANINGMATKLSDLIETQSMLTRQSEAVKNATIKIAAAKQRAEVYALAVRETHKTLAGDRVIYCQFTDNKSTIVAAESLNRGQSSILNTEILDADSIDTYLKQEQNKIRVEAIDDLDRANVSEFHRHQMQSLGIKASLIAPVIVENKLDGLLITHQSAKRSWSDKEVEFITQVASQIEFGVTRLIFQEKQKQNEIKEKAAKEAIQSRALDLLQEVDEVGRGNLTIRAKVTEDEIGTIADAYNATIESLHELVNEVKSAAVEVQNNTSINNVAVRALAQETLTQAQDIARTLERVNEMERSIEQVAENASKADDFVKQTNLTIGIGDRAMNHTVAEINAVQNTVTETAIKVQKLGDSSQEISQAVNLVGRFAAQTHLLALKASIEAARAGEQGKGFAVIANEVRSLATQSAEATAEIETLVSKIQLETNELAEAMNQGTIQIAAGNELVRQTRQSLTQITQAGSEISKLVSSITQATKQQSQTSARVSQTMVNVAEVAKQNSQSATQVSSSIEKLETVAERLQAGIGKFKT